MREANEAARTLLLSRAIPDLEQVTSLIADIEAAQTATLHNAVLPLAHLAKELAAEREKQATDLNKFAADAGLERIRELMAEQRHEFDALDFIGESRFGRGRDLWGSEEFHSRVLAWLLDPKQSHGLDDRCLIHFLLQAGMRTADHCDWATTKVICEWENIVDGRWGYLDILIVNQTRQILCAIENKVFSSEHSEQLTRYRKALEVSFPTFAKFHVFLTPGGTLPVREEERRHWKPLTYSLVFDIVQQVVDSQEISVQESVRAFLRQYATTLRRNIMPESSISQQARKVYLEHREAIDLIVASKPDWMVEIKPWLKKAIKAIAQHPKWLLDLEDKNHIRFRTEDWDRYDAYQTGSGWAPSSNALFLFEFTFHGKLPYLQLSLSPQNETNARSRQRLFEAVRQHPQLFKPNAYSLPSGWTHLHESDYILDEADFGIGWDDGTTRAKLEKWITDFAAHELPAMNEIIVGCLQEIDDEK